MAKQVLEKYGTWIKGLNDDDEDYREECVRLSVAVTRHNMRYEFVKISRLKINSFGNGFTC